MEMSTVLRIDWFAESLPSIEGIEKLSAVVNAGEMHRRAFEEQVEANMGKGGQKDCLATGIGLYVLGRWAEAVEKLTKAFDCKEKYIYLGFAYSRLRDFGQAYANLGKSIEQGADKLYVQIAKADVHRRAGDYAAAEKELRKCKNFERVSAEYHYQAGRIADAQGRYSEAMENYKTAIELSPNHHMATFHLAYRCDLSGDEDAAIDYYKQIAANSPVYVNGLLNLAVLYEDRGDFEKAIQCVEKILKYHPNHARARMFKKDIESSRTMFVDEDTEKKKDISTQILETPLSDFELSVRSRNCFRKMNIQNLGDLMQVTESELLSYKNFGETSLREIKQILESKGLRLGAAREETQLEGGLLEDVEESDFGDKALLSKLVDDLNLSVRARKCLEKLNVRILRDLVEKTDAELLGCKNFGATSLNEIKAAIESLGLSLRTLD